MTTQSTPTMIERVARAIAKGADASETLWPEHVRTALEVLAAMRAPPWDMVDAGRWPSEDDGPLACWEAMLDYALKQGQAMGSRP